MDLWSCQQSKLVFSCFKIPLQHLSASNRDFSELRAALKLLCVFEGSSSTMRSKQRSCGWLLGLVLTRALKFTLIWGQLRCLSQCLFFCAPSHSTVTLKTQNGGSQTGLEAAPASFFQILSFPRINFSSGWIQYRWISAR